MVKLEEVADDYDDAFVDESSEAEEDDDMSSIASDVSDLSDVNNETLYDRLVALSEIIPYQHRRRIVRLYKGVYSWGRVGIKWGGTAAWVITTSAVLLGLPLALAVEQEIQIDEQIRAHESQQQMMYGSSPEQQANSLMPPDLK